MKPFLFLAAAAMALLPAAGANAAAGDTPDMHDAKCVVVMVNMGQKQTDETAKNSFNGVMLYFVGKLSGRHTAAEVGGLIAAAEKALAPADYQAVGGECAQEMMKVGDILQGK